LIEADETIKFLRSLLEPCNEVGVLARHRRAVLIPTGADAHALAQSRRPMDMMVQGWSTSLFQAAQQ
jgi:hypothetical protein